MVKPRKTWVYVDGFNLYYGALRKTRNKWVNPLLLTQTIFKNDLVDHVVYCTARVTDRPNSVGVSTRQDKYLRALTSLGDQVEILEGKFSVKNARMAKISEANCVCCSGTSIPCSCCHGATIGVIKTEEKGSDVNLAVRMVRDGFMSKYEHAVVISNDSDMQLAVDLVEGDLGIPVTILGPRRNQYGLRSKAKKLSIFPKVLAACQFPRVVDLGDNKSVTIPKEWE